MKKESNDYFPKETEKFRAERNAKRDAERKSPEQLIWDSNMQGTFVGSIRQKFTGICRNNMVY